MMNQINHIIKKMNNYHPKFLGYRYEHAVLLPLVYWNNEWQILFEIRSHNITHPGEVSLPGGRVEKNETALRASLRETYEEIGFPMERIKVLGEIDRIANGRRIVHCFVGILEGFNKDELIINKDEVAEVFFKPLDYFLENDARLFTFESERRIGRDFPENDFKNIDTQKLKTGVYEHVIPYYPAKEEIIWGLTAQIIQHFIDVIK